MTVSIAAFIACFIGMIVFGFVTDAIIDEMEARLGSVHPTKKYPFWSGMRDRAVRSDFRNLFPGDRLNRRYHLATGAFFICVLGAFIVLFGILPLWAPPSR